MSAQPRIGMFFLSFGKDVFAGMENSLYNLALGFLGHRVPVYVYTGYLSGESRFVDGIRVHRSAHLPRRLIRGDRTVRSVLLRKRKEICEEIEGFIAAKRLSHLYICDPLWGIVQPTGVWRRVSRPMLLSLRVLNTDDLLQEAASIPYDLFTAVSASLAAEVSQHVTLRNLHVIPNSFNAHLFKADSSDQANSMSARPTIFCNGRIAPEKGTETLLFAFARVLKSIPDAKLVLCGGPYPFGDGHNFQQRIRTLMASMGLSDSVRILPALRWAAIPELIRTSAVVVVPSLSETFGRAALEAMACGRPLIVTSVGNLPGLVGDAALIVPPESPEALAEAIVTVLGDRRLQERMTLTGPTIAAAYTNEHVTSRLLHLFGIDVGVRQHVGKRR